MIYPPESSGGLIKLHPKFQPLILYWALQLLSAVIFIHSHGIIYRQLDNESIQLQFDLSLLLASFMDADFRDDYKYQGRSSIPDASVKSDIYGWVLFLYRLMTNNDQKWLEIKDFSRSHNFDVSSDLPVIEEMRKCVTRQYDTVAQLDFEFQEGLKAQGYELNEHNLRETHQILTRADG
jgi:serine/threonine protein kinase